MAFAFFHREGRGGLPKDPEMARRSIERAARRDLAPAQALLAVWELESDRRDSAREWFRKAEEGGDPKGCFGLGRILLEDGEREAAIGWIRMAADQGLPEALAELSRLALAGEVHAEREQIQGWLRTAAGAGNARAQLKLGRILLEDPASLEEGTSLIERAAEAGLPEAPYRAAMLLGPDRETQAIRWLLEAAEEGHLESQFEAGRKLASKDDPEERRQGTEWLRKASESGHPAARFLLALGLLEDPERREEGIA